MVYRDGKTTFIRDFCKNVSNKLNTVLIDERNEIAGKSNEFTFNVGDYPSEVQLNGDKTKLYWINDDIWCMSVTASSVPSEPFLPSQNTIYYGLTVCPTSGDVYIADAIDYVQQGKIYRYSSDSELIDEFYAGIIPGAFCWK